MLKLLHPSFPCTPNTYNTGEHISFLAIKAHNHRISSSSSSSCLTERRPQSRGMESWSPPEAPSPLAVLWCQQACQSRCTAATCSASHCRCGAACLLLGSCHSYSTTTTTTTTFLRRLCLRLVSIRRCHLLSFRALSLVRCRLCYHWQQPPRRQRDRPRPARKSRQRRRGSEERAH